MIPLFATLLASLPLFSSIDQLNKPALSISSTNDPKVCLDWLIRNPSSVYGFDLENVPGGQGFVNGGDVATVQLATEAECLVYQKRAGEGWPECLARTLEDRNIIKVGCAVDDDALDLWSEGLTLNSRLDLGGLSGSVRRRVGLANLTYSLLDLDMPKSRRVMLSDWSKTLTREQVEYAALDAWAGRACYDFCVIRWGDLEDGGFAIEKVKGLLGCQMEVEEMERRRKARRAAKGEIERLRREGYGWGSEEAKPFRQQLDANRADSIPTFKGIQIEFKDNPNKVKKGKKGAKSGSWQRKKKGKDIAPAKMSKEEMDIIAEAIMDIDGYDYLLDE